MHFTNPYALWFLGLIPLFIIIHNLRSKRKQVAVTNLFLWRELIAVTSRGFRIRRLILRNLSLFLQILMVILATLALANPVSYAPSLNKGDIILVFDTSASMKTLTGSGTRFERAKAKALELIDELQTGSRMLIIEASSEPKITSRFLEDKGKLREVINMLQPTDAPGRIMKTLYTALAFVDPAKDDSLVVITDGSGGQWRNISTINEKIRPILITGGTNNVGITKFEFRQELDSENAYEIMLELKNFNSHPILCPVHISLDGTTVLQKTIGLSSLGKRLLIFPYYGLIAGTAEAHLHVDDDFPTDNTAYSVLSTSQDIWVLLVSKGNYFLEALLQAYPNVLVNSVNDVYPDSWERQVKGHDIVIIDQTPFPAVEKGNLFIIDSFSPSLPLSKIGQVDQPQILDWDQNNPLMADLDFRGLQIASASMVKADKTLKPLLESPQTGLIYTFQKQGLRAVFVGFDIGRSDLPLRIAFPVMMSNFFQWLYPNKLMFSTAQIRAGEPFPIYLDSRTDHVSIRTPSGKWEKISITSNPLLYTNTYQTGLYRIAEDDKRRHFAVNLVDESESDIRVPDLMTEEAIMDDALTNSLTRTVTPITTERPLWFIFLIVVLGVLFLEWYNWIWNRR